MLSSSHGLLGTNNGPVFKITTEDVLKMKENVMQQCFQSINNIPITQFHTLLKNTKHSPKENSWNRNEHSQKHYVHFNVYMYYNNCCYKILEEVMNDNLNMPAIFNLHNLFMLLHVWPASSSCQTKSSEKPRGMNRSIRNIWADLVRIFWELLISYSATLKKSKQRLCNIVLPNVTITCSNTQQNIHTNHASDVYTIHTILSVLVQCI